MSVNGLAEQSSGGSAAAQTPIAVIGMACRLPGGINSPQQLWEALLAGEDLVTEIPRDRWDIDDYFDPQRGVPGRTISRWGGFLEDPDSFDPSFFGLDEAKAAAIDPQHRLLMETSLEAIEYAGLDPASLAGSATGVYFGISHNDHTPRAFDAGVYGYTETASCMASGRVAYHLNVNGPALTLDTACSSSLFAIHMACRGLDSGDAELALAGGCLVMNEPRTNNWASAQGMLSPTGRCKAFDVAADGFVRSEGCAVLLLKRLPDAVRDGDRILAVVRATASNSDGRTRNIATPSLEAQVGASRAALATAAIDPDTVGVVEAHGTGTPVGDPIEFGSLAETYGKTAPVLLGSAKSNFGHTEAAAGAVGVIKAILELQHGVVPPMVHFTRLPDQLAAIETGLTVPRVATAWPEGHGDVRRVAVASYGISGTNVHAILEQAPEPTDGEETVAVAEGTPMVFALSSTSDDGLRRTAEELADWVEDASNDAPLSDIATTLARRRGHRSVRTGVIAENRGALVEALRSVAGGDNPFPPTVGRDDHGPVWVFSGQGSQWAGMGTALMETEPVFAATIAELEPLIAAESGFSVTEAICSPDEITGIDRIQPSIFAMQVAMAATMTGHGVRPGAVIGQSMGEVAAAVTAGALSLADGVKVICRRSRLCRDMAGGGAMASVDLPAPRIRAELEKQGIDDVEVAVIASPGSTVIGGAPDTVRRLIAGWKGRDITAREIAVDVASHTPHVEPVLAELGELLADLSPMPPQVPYYTATQFDAREQPHCDADYWLDNLRHTVRFSAAVQTALEDGFRVFAEIAPHPVAVRSIDQIAADLQTPAVALAGMRRGPEMEFGLLTLLADLYVAGAKVDPAGTLPRGRLVDLPLPAWSNVSLGLPALPAPVARTAKGAVEDGPVAVDAEDAVLDPETSEHRRLFDERLLAVEWTPKPLPAVGDLVLDGMGGWLLITTAESADMLALDLADHLKLHHADVTVMSWPQRGDQEMLAGRLAAHLAGHRVGNVVVTPPRGDGPPGQLPTRGADQVRALVHIARVLADTDGQAPRLSVITREAQTVTAGDRPNLEHAGLRGLLRCIGAEQPQLRPTQIDVDTSTTGEQIARLLMLDGDEDETAFRSGEWYTARLAVDPLRPDERFTAAVDHARDGMRLEIRTPGDLSTMELAVVERVAPAAGEIEVDVTVAGVNFVDALAALGRIPGGAHLGSDFSGVVTAVGPGVTAHRVGDHVGGISPNGSWGTFVTCAADLAVRLPHGLRDDQAAAVTTSAATAWHGLCELARITAGDKVLIHSATGGVGQAAIAIARRAGAEIFATAGSEERRDLLRHMGIEHVYDSHTTDFAEQIRRDTGGYGIDVVLNSLIGAGQVAGMDLLAYGGRFVEMSEGEDDAEFSAVPLRRNLSFYSVDMARLAATNPARVRDLISTVYQLYADGALPHPQTTVYPLPEAAAAISAMDAGEHTGKLILSVPRVGYSTVVVPPEKARVFRADAAYIVTGGLGGLGLFLAGKMAESGAGRIVLNSRSAPSPAALEAIARMRSLGTGVAVVTGDIAASETVDRLIDEATGTGLAVRGVLHAAAVVEDATLATITDELIERDWSPKVYGAWHLHRATATQPLDWFCSFSSAAALVGSPGQGAYAAANSWLDAFTQWRRAQGMPASAVAWAAWDEIGAGKHLAESGTATMINPEEGAYVFEELLRHNRGYAGYSPVTGAPWLTDLAARSPFGEEFASGERSAGGRAFREEVLALTQGERAARVRRVVAEQLSLILRTPVDPDRPIVEYGLDSLGHLELRSRLESETGVRVRSSDITTVRALADTVCTALEGAAVT